MKLRIKGDSIRLRLTIPEVEAIEAQGIVESKVHVTNGDWVYRLLTTNADKPSAQFIVTGGIEVRLPASLVKGWINNERVGFEFTIPNGREDGLALLIEKDFACLTERPEEDESLHFPNPDAERGHGV